MSRHVYHLQSETIKVLTGNVEGVADQMDVSTRHIYNILEGRETDPFAKFLELYRAAVRDGAPVRHWDDRLAEVRDIDRREDGLSIQTEAKRYAKESTDAVVASIDGDPHAVLREAREAIAQGKRLERAALAAMGTREFAAVAVSGRNGNGRK